MLLVLCGRHVTSSPSTYRLVRSIQCDSIRVDTSSSYDSLSRIDVLCWTTTRLPADWRLVPMLSPLVESLKRTFQQDGYRYLRLSNWLFRIPSLAAPVQAMLDRHVQRGFFDALWNLRYTGITWWSKSKRGEKIRLVRWPSTGRATAKPERDITDSYIGLL